MPIKLLNWNLEWAKRGAWRGEQIAKIISTHDPAIACVTEAYEDNFATGHTITSDPDYGYPQIAGRRKVLLWSREPWRQVDPVGDTSLPTGRFVSGVTTTVIGDVEIIGVCIPWLSAHVSTGRKDRQRWEDHEQYLTGLENILKRHQGLPLIVVGDFNQTFPRIWAPQRMFDLLQNATGLLKISTAGIADENGKQTIDHLCHCESLTVKNQDVISRTSADGKPLSDHFGIIAIIN